MPDDCNSTLSPLIGELDSENVLQSSIVPLSPVRNKTLEILPNCLGIEFSKIERKEINIDNIPHLTDNSMKVNICVSCGVGFTRKDNLIRHMQSHDGLGVACSICGKLFRSKYDLDNHSESKHKLITFKCSIKGCHKTLKTKDGCRSHEVIKHGIGGKCFSCKECSSKFIRQSELTYHRYKQHGVVRYSCQLCSRNFFYDKSLKRHLLICPGYSSAVMCIFDSCNLNFKRKDYMMEHYNAKHLMKLFSCANCPKTFTRKSGLLKHKCVPGD